MTRIDEILKEIARMFSDQYLWKNCTGWWCASQQKQEEKKPFSRLQKRGKGGVKKELIHDREMCLADCSCSSLYA